MGLRSPVAHRSPRQGSRRGEGRGWDRGEHEGRLDPGVPVRRSERAEDGRGGRREPATEPQLRRQIGLYAATAITVGNIVGSGIFRSPHSVAQRAPSEAARAVAPGSWAACSRCCGSLALAELAVAHPRTGGLYVFIREGFGDALAFVFGWASLWVIKPTVIASITSVFALYFCEAVGSAPAARSFRSGSARSCCSPS